MDIGWLQDFLTLAETGNFTRAASKRNVSQAAFSRRIQGLENWLGVTLVDRSTYPARLTPEGERFQAEANDTLTKLLDARAALADPAFGRNAHVRVALPHVLSVARFAGWWRAWSAGGAMSISVTTGNITDIVAGFVAGAVDVLICHHADQAPMLLDPELFVEHVIEPDRLRPFVAADLLESGDLRFPGTEEAPVPLLMYSRGAYFTRLVDLIIEQGPQPLAGVRRIETDMANVLHDCIAAGYGVGWLPDCAVDLETDTRIVPLPTEGWSMDLRITAFAHKSRSAAADGLWRKIAGDVDSS